MHLNTAKCEGKSRASCEKQRYSWTLRLNTSGGHQALILDKHMPVRALVCSRVTLNTSLNG